MKTKKAIGLIFFYVFIVVGTWNLFQLIVDLYLGYFKGSDLTDEDLKGLICEFEISNLDLSISFLFCFLFFGLAFFIRKKTFEET